MRRTLFIVMLLACTAAMARNERDTLGVGTKVMLVQNLGQWDSRVRYEAQLHDAAIFLEDDGITVALREHRSHPAIYNPTPPKMHAYKIQFVGASATPMGEVIQPGYNNYFIGKDETRWKSRVPSYAVARYINLYPGIDMEVYTASGATKYNFIVHPGADPSQIKLEYLGTDGVSVTMKGDMRIKTSVRDIVELTPYVFQQAESGKSIKLKEVKSRWRVESGKDGYFATFEVGEYDRTNDLVIDPTLIFSTYTGSNADNWGTTATYDLHKNVYTAGLVFNIGYPVSLGAYDIDYNGGVDIGIFKFNPSGSNRLFATYFGGSLPDMPHSMFVNSLNELLIFGTTGSANFPVTADAYQTEHAGGTLIDYESSMIRFTNGSDIFVSRFSSDGTQLKASTYVGGSGNDGLNFRQYYNNNSNIVMCGNDSLYYNYGDGARGELITDDLNNVYVGSTTMSNNFPTTPGCVQSTYNAGQEGVVFKLDFNLKNMLWSTYLGGSSNDAVYSIDVDSSYNLLCCGGTSSINFPVTDSAYQTSYGNGTSAGNADGFVSKISYSGDKLLASTYIGDRFYDQLYFVRCGKKDEVFLFGQTAATGNTMIYNAGYSVYGSGMLLVRMDPELKTRRWSTVFGTSGRINLSPTAFAADICNRVYCSGWGRDFVPYNGNQWYTSGTHGMETTTNAYQDSTDGQDFYIMSIDADANNLEYASFFGELHQIGGSSYGGGDHVDGGTSRFDRLATLYQSVCGSCGHTNGFPTTSGAWSDTNRSNNCNNALFCFNVANDFPVAEFIQPPIGCAPYTVLFNNTGRGTSFHWDFGDGTTSTSMAPTHTYNTAGYYVVTLIANMAGGCATADTVRRIVQVLTSDHFSHTPLKSCDARLQIGPRPTIGATYQWTGNVSDPTVANPWVDSSGVYILRTTGDGCTQVDTYYVNTYVLVDNWQKTAITCHDSADGKAMFHLGNNINTDSITYTITPSAISHIASPNTLVFEGLTHDVNYTVSIHGYGCTWEQMFHLDNPRKPYYEKKYTKALCSDSCNGWIKLIYNISLVPEESTSDTLIDSLCPGTYYTSLVDRIGCPLFDTTTIIRSHMLDSLKAWADGDTIYLGESVGLHATTGNNDNNIQWSWHPVTEINNPASQNPIATPGDTLSCYTVTATNEEGCSASTTVCVHCTEVICGAPLFNIPNAFTPNGDGVNDRLCCNGIEDLTAFHIAIFNRWGEKVFESDDPNNCWDGSYKNNACMPGVYTYTCHIECHANQRNDFKGDITLIR